MLSLWGLPDDPLLQALSYCAGRDLARVSQVSRRGRSLTESNEAWEGAVRGALPQYIQAPKSEWRHRYLSLTHHVGPLTKNSARVVTTAWIPPEVPLMPYGRADLLLIDAWAVVWTSRNPIIIHDTRFPGAPVRVIDGAALIQEVSKIEPGRAHLRLTLTSGARKVYDLVTGRLCDDAGEGAPNLPVENPVESLALIRPSVESALYRLRHPLRQELCELDDCDEASTGALAIDPTFPGRLIRLNLQTHCFERLEYRLSKRLSFSQLATRVVMVCLVLFAFLRCALIPQPTLR